MLRTTHRVRAVAGVARVSWRAAPAAPCARPTVAATTAAAPATAAATAAGIRSASSAPCPTYTRTRSLHPCVAAPAAMAGSLRSPASWVASARRTPPTTTTTMTTPGGSSGGVQATRGQARGLATQSREDRSREGNPEKTAFTLDNVAKRLDMGNRTLFEKVSLGFFDGAKIGILGANGSGKSSLLKIIAGVDKEFEGVAQPLAGMRIGYLAQEPVLDPSKTVMQNVMDGLKYKTDLLKQFEDISAKFADPDADMDKLIEQQGQVQSEIERLGCWELDHKLQIAMDALRCPPGDSSVVNLSGGERRRVALARLLLSEPDILLLDEPTNHLDAESVAWLEQFLDSYKGLVVAITHDRYFLDNVVGWILEIDQGRAIPFKGNYQQWLASKQARLLAEARKETKMVKVMERELTWLRQAARGGVTKSKARIARVEKKQETREAEKAARRKDGGALIIPEGPRLVHGVELKDISLEIEGRTLFKNLTLNINDGHVLGIVGPNGVGKTTLIRMLSGELQPTTGTITIGAGVSFAYNRQSRDGINEDECVWKEITGSNEWIAVSGSQRISARAYVAQFNFHGNDQVKLCGSLSGGERNRVQLAKSLRQGANFIMLDEPTNDLDVGTLRALEEALTTFEGAAVIVSHDRYFLDRVATHILAFEDDGSHSYTVGNFSEWAAEFKGKDWQPGTSKRRFKRAT